MKVIPVNGGQPFDVATGHGLLLISEGRVRRFDPAKDGPKLKPNTVWGSALYAADGKPFISYKCSSCSQHGHLFGPNAADFKFVHCFTTEKVPSSIAAEFAERRAQWQPPAVIVPTEQKEAEVKMPTAFANIF